MDIIIRFQDGAVSADEVFAFCTESLKQKANGMAKDVDVYSKRYCDASAHIKQT